MTNKEAGAALREVNVATILDKQNLRRAHLVIWALCFADNLLDGFDAQLMAFTAPAITRDWHILPSPFAIVFMAAAIGFGVGNFGSGPLADRYGRKNAIVAATLFYALATLVTPLTTSILEITVLRFIAGVGLGAVMPNAFAITSEYAPARYRATMIATMFAGSPLGGVLAGLSSSVIIPKFGWVGAFYLGGLLPLILLPFIVLALPESVRYLVAKGRSNELVARYLNRISGTTSFVGNEAYVLLAQPKKAFFIKQLFADGRAASSVLIALVYITNQITLFFLGNWLPLLLHAAKMSPANLLLISSLFFLGGAVGGSILGRVVDRFGAYRVLIPIFSTTVVVSALIGYSTGNHLGLSIVIFLSGFCGFGGQIATHTITAAIYPTGIRSSGMAWALGLGRLGSIVGSGAGGLLLGLNLATPQLFLLLTIPTTVAVVSLCALAIVRRGMPDAA